MTYDIRTALSPKRKEDGGINYRYSEGTRKILELTGELDINRLIEFFQQTDRLEREYSNSALKLCKSYWICNDKFDLYESRAFKKTTLNVLRELGFKKDKASAVLGAARLLYEVSKLKVIIDIPNYLLLSFTTEMDDDYLDQFKAWINSLNLYPLYDLSRMNVDGIHSSFIELSGKGKYQVTRDQLREMQSKHPKDEHETRGRRRNRNLPGVSVLKDDPSPVIVVDDLMVNHLDDGFKFVEYLDRIDLEYLVVGVKEQLTERIEKLEALLETIKCFSNKTKQPTTTH